MAINELQSHSMENTSAVYNSWINSLITLPAICHNGGTQRDMVVRAAVVITTLTQQNNSQVQQTTRLN